MVFIIKIIRVNKYTLVINKNNIIKNLGIIYHAIESIVRIMSLFVPKTKSPLGRLVAPFPVILYTRSIGYK